MTQITFPKLLASQIAFDIARTILDGFNKHYRLFRATSHQAKIHFEVGEWQAAQKNALDRISFYAKRASECVTALENNYDESELTDAVWREIKLHYIGLLIDHMQPELAETFFNTVCTRMLHRNYFHNDFIFVRPAIATDYIESDALPTYRVYYPGNDRLQSALKKIIADFQLATPFENIERDIALVAVQVNVFIGSDRLEPNHQLQVLSNLFFRNKGAYIVGKVIFAHAGLLASVQTADNRRPC